MLSALAPGFSRAAVEALSHQKGEPAWMLQLRLRAWEIYENTLAPLGRRGDLGTLRTVANFKFENLNPFTPSTPPHPTDATTKGGTVNRVPTVSPDKSGVLDNVLDELQ